jgi:hypothetical protein
LVYLSNKAGTGLALASGAVGTTNAGEALGVLNLATTNLLGEFANSGPTAEKSLQLSIWDSERDRMLASQPIPVRNNPLAAQFVEGWTNVPEAVLLELQATAEAAVFAAQRALDRTAGYSNDIETVKSGLATLATGKVDAAAAAGWETGSHTGLLTKIEAAETYQPAGNYISHSNLASHVQDTNNPHHVTAEQIGALTAEQDPAFAVWEPTAHVPVSCSGGWLYPDFFTMSTYPYATTGAVYGTTSRFNSVNAQWRWGNQKGTVLDPTVIHVENWTNSVHYAQAENLVIESNVSGRAWAAWTDGAHQRIRWPRDGHARRVFQDDRTVLHRL